ncbi:hypothetical protein K402DRAFT_397622 [Aulographum hederae CBS 113979]|uniref:Uncharacterized protein n=1 Tax=Aulographum hederae CBS 113979 TaxID=1176131 RepID=A0A6G1GNM8_9PEZI|nr:hypothetical protein K402DRAFT_397622 [Aulographum hederae CBS 113979]
MVNLLSCGLALLATTVLTASSMPLDIPEAALVKKLGFADPTVIAAVQPSNPEKRLQCDDPYHWAEVTMNGGQVYELCVPCYLCMIFVGAVDNAIEWIGLGNGTTATMYE